MDLDAYTSKVRDIREAASSDDGLIHAIADGTGRIVDLKLRAEVMGKTHTALAQSLLATIAKAQKAARTRTSEGLNEFRKSLDKQVARDIEESRAAAERSAARLETLMTDLGRRLGSMR